MRESATLTSTARPSAPPIMNAVLTMPEARPALGGLDVAHGGEQQRVEGDPASDSHDDHARQHVDDEAAVGGDPREPRGGRSRSSVSPPTIGGLTPKRITSRSDRAIEPARHDQRGRQVRRVRPRAGCSRARAGGRARTGRTSRTWMPPAVTPTTLATEMLRRRNRPSGISGEPTRDSIGDEDGEQRRGRAQQSERLAGGPAVVVAVDDRVGAEHHRSGHGDRAGNIQPAVLASSGRSSGSSLRVSAKTVIPTGRFQGRSSSRSAVGERPRQEAPPPWLPRRARSGRGPSPWRVRRVR